ncbi:hypothetical protein GCM10017690_08360 [Microbacterium terregens]
MSVGPKWSLRSLPVALLRLWPDRHNVLRAVKSAPAASYGLHFKREQITLSRALAKTGRVVWTEHGRFPSGVFGLLIRPFYRRAARHAAVIICVSHVVAASISSRVDPGTELRVIETSIETSERLDRQSARDQLGLSNTSRVAAVVGRLAPSKRPELAIRAALEANYSVIVAGTGTMERALRRRYHNHPGVRLLGHVPDSRIAFAASDVHIFASNGRGEGFPTVLLESAGYGVPTVGCTGTGFELIIEQAGGAVANPTPRALADAIAAVENRPSLAETAARWAESKPPAEWLLRQIAAYRGAL